MRWPETHSHRENPSPFVLKFAGRVPVQYVLAYLHYAKQSRVQRLVHAIKYQNQKEAAELIGRWYGYRLKAEWETDRVPDLLTSVPLHPARLRQRGYNQSDWFGRGLAQAMDIPFKEGVLQRTAFVASQTGKSRFDRWQNVETVFRVARTDMIRERNVALVDDVLTTGATLEACAQALLTAGCASVGVITIAATR